MDHKEYLRRVILSSRAARAFYKELVLPLEGEVIIGTVEAVELTKAWIATNMAVPIFESEGDVEKAG